MNTPKSLLSRIRTYLANQTPQQWYIAAFTAIGLAVLVICFALFWKQHVREVQYVRLLKQANAAYVQGNYTDAVNLVNQAAPLRTHASLHHILRAKIYIAQKQGKEVLPELTKAVQESTYEGRSEQAAAYGARGQRERAEHDINSAINDLGQAIKLNPTDYGIYKTYEEALIGSAMNSKTKDDQTPLWKEVLSATNTYLAQIPHDSEVLTDRGLAYGQLGQCRAATANLKAAQKYTKRADTLNFVKQLLDGLDSHKIKCVDDK